MLPWAIRERSWDKRFRSLLSCFTACRTIFDHVLDSRRDSWPPNRFHCTFATFLDTQMSIMQAIQDVILQGSGYEQASAKHENVFVHCDITTETEIGADNTREVAFVRPTSSDEFD